MKTLIVLVMGVGLGFYFSERIRVGYEYNNELLKEQLKEYIND